MNNFPLRIESDGEQSICHDVGELPTHKPFTILETCYKPTTIFVRHPLDRWGLTRAIMLTNDGVFFFMKSGTIRPADKSLGWTRKSIMEMVDRGDWETFIPENGENTIEWWKNSVGNKL